MSTTDWFEVEPTEAELRALRATLLAHAGEIALACATLGDDAILYAQVARDGTWRGLLAAQVREDPGPYVAGEHLAFVVPARCRDAGAVRALVCEHLGAPSAG